MSDLIDREALDRAFTMLRFNSNGELAHWGDRKDWCLHGSEIEKLIADAPTIYAVPVKFIREVIEYLTKCRDNAIHEETKTAWDEQRQTLIMLLHEWDAWNEFGRTGKYGERRANDGTD